jgi:hypothetical protein
MYGNAYWPVKRRKRLAATSPDDTSLSHDPIPPLFFLHRAHSRIRCSHAGEVHHAKPSSAAVAYSSLTRQYMRQATSLQFTTMPDRFRFLNSCICRRVAVAILQSHPNIPCLMPASALSARLSVIASPPAFSVRQARYLCHSQPQRNH